MRNKRKTFVWETELVFILWYDTIKSVAPQTGLEGFSLSMCLMIYYQGKRY